MRLSLSEIVSLAHGAVRAEESEGYLRLCRFTAEQEAYYARTSPRFHLRSLGSSGISLRFRTNSPTLRLAGRVTPGSSRTYYAIDVLANGAPVGVLRNFNPSEMIGNFTKEAFPLGDFSGEWALGEGEKTVEIVLPFSVCAEISELSLADGAHLSPVPPGALHLAYGDSITQGYDVLSPQNGYVARLLRASRAPSGWKL